MTLQQASEPTEQAAARPGMSLPLEVAVLPVPRLLEILDTSPTTLSRSEADRLAAEAAVDDLVGFLSREDEGTVERTVLILGLKGSEEGVEALTQVVESTGAESEIREMALQALASCGPRGRRQLLALSRRADLVGETIEPLDRAASSGGFRPAAMARLAEIAADASLSKKSRALALLAVVRGGWAAGAGALRGAADDLGCADLVDSWESAGWYVREPEEPEDAASLFLLDFESTFFRAFEEASRAREQSTERLEEQMKLQCAERLAAAEAQEPVPQGRVGRNDLCPCGSGKKYKKCCIGTAPTRRPDVLAREYQSCPLPVRGFKVSMFDRPLDEQAALARVAAATAAADLPRRVDGQPFVAWAAALRLQEFEAYPRALRLVMDILERWDEDPGLDYVDMLLCAIMLAAPRAPEVLPTLLDMAARRAPSWAVLEYVMVLRHADADLGPFLELLLRHRADDVEALLAWVAGAEGPCLTPSEETVVLLERLEDLLARHDDLDFAHQAFLRVESARSELEEVLIGEEGSDDGAEEDEEHACGGCEHFEAGGEGAACEGCGEMPPESDPQDVRALQATEEEADEDDVRPLPWLEVDTTSLSVYLQADGRADLIETGLEEPVELLEEASLEPWEQECEIRRQALQAERERMEAARRAVVESLVASLRAIPGVIALCRLEDGVSWMLPVEAGLEMACVAAAAAGLMKARLSAGPLTAASRGGRLCLHLAVDAEPGESLLPVARQVLEDVAAGVGFTLPDLVRVPLCLTDWLPAEPLPALAPADHPLAIEAARQETSILRLAEQWGAEGMTPPWLLASPVG